MTRLPNPADHREMLDRARDVLSLSPGRRLRLVDPSVLKSLTWNDVLRARVVGGASGRPSTAVRDRRARA